MHKPQIIIFYLIISLLLISNDNKAQNDSTANKTGNISSERKKVTGIGGIFFKTENPEKIRKWYNKNLGLVTNEYGSMFEFRQSETPDKKAYLQWSPFDKNTKYFDPSEKEFMINYRVQNIEELVEELKQNGVIILDTLETYDYGKFIHILDPENNKIELWEPAEGESFEGETTK